MVILIVTKKDARWSEKGEESQSFPQKDSGVPSIG